MKLLKKPFLFFYVINTAFLVLNSHSVFAIQQNTKDTSKDSLMYYVRLINHPQKSLDLTKAYQYFKTHKEHALRKDKTEIVIYDLFQMSRINYKGGFYTDSEELAVEALKLLDQLDETTYNKLLKKSIYTHLGIIYREQNNSQKALDLYNGTLKIAETVEDSIILFNNRSNVYKDGKAYKMCQKELLKAYSLIPRTKDTLTIALILDNLGYVNTKFKEENGLPLMLKALELRKLLRATPQTYTSYRHLAEYYKTQNNIKSAKEYALKAYHLAKTINSTSYIEDALSIMVELGDDNYAKEYKTISDSLRNTKQLQENRFALIKYDILKKEKELQKSEIKKERIIIGSSFLFFILILSIVLLKTKHKKDKLKAVYNTETRISKKVHDEVANDVYYAMAKLQKNPDDKGALLDDLEKIYDRTRDISKGIGTIDMTIDFNDLLYDLLISYKSNGISVIASNLSKMDWKGVDDIKKASVYRVLQELMTNMKKHSQASIVVLSFKHAKSKIEIDYKDNGIGCNLIKNNGLQNAENRMASIKGTITFESNINDGFKAKITI